MMDAGATEAALCGSVILAATPIFGGGILKLAYKTRRTKRPTVDFGPARRSVR